MVLEAYLWNLGKEEVLGFELKNFQISLNTTRVNINVPKSIPSQKIKGLKVCQQAAAKWKEEFIERKDAKGDIYYWLTGKFICEDNSNKTDEWALDNQYVSIVPVKFDLTSYSMIKEIQDFFHD